MKNKLLLIIAILLSFSFSHKESLAQRNHCKQILIDGIFDVENINYNSYNKVVYASTMAYSETGETDQKKTLSGNVVIDGIPIGGEFNESEYKYWMKNLKKSEKFEEIFKYNVSIMRSTANEKIINAWKGCISDGGLDLYYEEHGEYIILNFDWFPNFNVNSIIIDTILIKGAEIISGKNYLKDYEIDGRGNGKIILNRNSKGEGILALIIPQKGEVLTAYFPPNIVLPPIVRGFKFNCSVYHGQTQISEWQEYACKFGEKFQIYCNYPTMGREYGGVEINPETYEYRTFISGILDHSPDPDPIRYGSWFGAKGEISEARYRSDGHDWKVRCYKTGELIVD